MRSVKKTRVKLFRLRFSTGGSSRKTRFFRLDPTVGILSRKKLSRKSPFSRVQVGTGFIVGSQRDGNAMCRDTLAGLPGLSFLPVPPSRYPGQSKYAGTFSTGTQHAGTAFGGTRYSKMCRYFFAGNATCRDRLRRHPVQQNMPVLFRRECNMPEIDANEVNRLASLTGRTVGFARSSEGDGCTRTKA